MKGLTIIVPVFNEEASIPRLRKAMDEFLEINDFPVTVLFVNDGSEDDSYSLMKEIVRGDKRYKLISLTRNSGLSAAIKAGIDYADTPWVGYIDADLQTSPMDFLKFYKFMGSADMVTGIRMDRHDSFVKRWSSIIANSVRSRMIGDGILDTGCPLKIMRTSLARQIPFFNGTHRFLPAHFQLLGGKVVQVEVQHFERMEGKSKYSLGNRLTGPLLDMLAFMWMKRRFMHYTVMEQEMVPSYKREAEAV